MQTWDFYGYGKYSVTMRPAAMEGTVSSFFTHTGPKDKTPWDEIDIEFPGKDTTTVQFNYFHNGVGGSVLQGVFLHAVLNCPRPAVFTKKTSGVVRTSNTG